MGVIYAQGSDPGRLEPAELSERLASVLRTAMPWLAAISDDEASVPEREGKWSAKQVMGHLTDSAVNNLGRMVRMQLESGLHMAGYDQMGWVNMQHYAERSWPEVLGLWFALNEHVVWMVAHMEKRFLQHVGVVEGDTLTLGFLIEDYIAHMQHHLRAMRAWVGPGTS